MSGAFINWNSTTLNRPQSMVAGSGIEPLTSGL